MRNAYLLADPDQKSVPVSQGPHGEYLVLPGTAPDPVCSVVVLDFDRAPEAGP